MWTAAALAPARFAVFLLAPAVLVSAGLATGPARADADSTRAAGLRLGPHAVGFEVRRAADPTRRVNTAGEAAAVGVATWYPAQAPRTGTPRLTALDYRLLDVRLARSAAQAAAFEETEVDTLVGWRHVGIIPLTRDQARASLRTSGIAVRDASPAAGRFPVIVVLGGQYYLSTTAEVLASHGFLVIAPFRFQDQSNEIETPGFTTYLENSLRDAEQALEHVRQDRRADARFVGAIGHGGGGMQAMLFAMRNRDVRAVVNIDAGNFSSRSGPRSVPFYSPRSMRTPYLFIATADTKRGQDLFDDFVNMAFAERVEVVLGHSGLRHHDLSDVGRAVTAPLGLRGEEMAVVQRTYVAAHDMTVRFLLATAGTPQARVEWRDWIMRQHAPGTIDIVHRPGGEPAPTTVEMLGTLGASTASRLAAARTRDPDAPLFQADQLARLIDAAIAAGDHATADAVSALALEWRPVPVVAELRSRALEARGEAVKALDAARACAAMDAGTQWRAMAAVDRCRERLKRLTDRR
jgi:dienelactone hydrolase